MLDYPTLRHLVGAYVNEDVFDFYPDAETAVADFVVDTSQNAPSLSAEVSTQVEAALSS